MAKKYIVTLTEDERATLEALTKTGKRAARTIARAHILLHADAGTTDEAIAAALRVGSATVERVRKRFVLEGLDAALTERPRPGGSRLLDAHAEAVLVAWTCAPPPDDRKRWTMQLLADKLVEVGEVAAVSDETVRRALKKNALKPWQVEEWCIPTVSSDFVWRMEDVLELYHEPYDPAYPVVCFDESPYQLVSEVRTPVPAQPGQPARIDYEYKREGTCNLFMLFDPHRGWRHVDVTAQRKALDFAHQMRDLVDIHYPKATLITVVLDNLNTHTPAALYDAFPPAEARRILYRLEFRYTPKHGSWLNMAEVEFAVIRRQCLDQRIATIATVRRKVAAWEDRRNSAKATVQWRFTTDKAREKLQRLYPSQS